MHYYQFNIADYRKDTQHLTPIEHYIYRELMDWYYLDESPIPKETQLVMRRLRLGSDNVSDIERVLSEYFEIVSDLYHHKRIDKEIEAYKRKADTARVNGSKGGRPRKPRKTQPVNLANPDVTQTKANHKPLTNNQYTTEFISFWEKYPRKENKNAGYKAWRKLTDKEKGLASKDCCFRYKETEKQFIPHPSSYLNGKRWEDEKPKLNGSDTPIVQDWI